MSASNSSKKSWKGISPHAIIVIAIIIIIGIKTADGWKLIVGVVALAILMLYMDSRYTIPEATAGVRIDTKGRVPDGITPEGEDGRKAPLVEHAEALDRTVQLITGEFSIMAVGTVTPPAVPAAPMPPTGAPAPAAPPTNGRTVTRPVKLTWKYKLRYRTSDRSVDSKRRARALTVKKEDAGEAADAVIDTLYSNLGSGHSAAILALHHKELTLWGLWTLTLAFMPWERPRVFGITDAVVDLTSPKSILYFTVNYGDRITQKIEEWKMEEAEHKTIMMVRLGGHEVPIFLPKIERDQAIDVIEFLPKEPDYPEDIDKANEDLVRAEVITTMIAGYVNTGLDVNAAKDLAEKTMKMVTANTLNITGIPPEVAGIAAAARKLLDRV